MINFNVNCGMRFKLVMHACACIISCRYLGYEHVSFIWKVVLGHVALVKKLKFDSLYINEKKREKMYWKLHLQLEQSS